MKTNFCQSTNIEICGICEGILFPKISLVFSKRRFLANYYYYYYYYFYYYYYYYYCYYYYRIGSTQAFPSDVWAAFREASPSSYWWNPRSCGVRESIVMYIL